jgi:hypothetical protein
VMQIIFARTLHGSNGPLPYEGLLLKPRSAVNSIIKPNQYLDSASDSVTGIKTGGLSTATFDRSNVIVDLQAAILRISAEPGL